MGGLGHRESEVGPGGLGEKLPLPANLAMGKNCASLLDNAPNYLVGCVTQKRYCQPKIIYQKYFFQNSCLPSFYIFINFIKS